jgi:acetyl esterase/lipase
MSFSLLGLINLLTPKSVRSRRLVRGLAYGHSDRQRLDVYGPTGTSAPVAVVVFVYGGSWSEGDRSDYEFAGRCLAALGYVVVVPDYRILPKAAYPDFLLDTAAAVQWAVANAATYGGDGRRVALVGHSAGAYNAVMVGLDARYGIQSHLRSVVGLSGPYDFYPYDVPITIRTFGAASDPLSTQPVNLVTPAAPPMFLGTGDSDKLVYPRNSVALAAKLREADIMVEERHYARFGHPQPLLELGSLLGGRSSLLHDVAGFLARTLS